MVSFKTNQRRAHCTLCMIARPADFRKEEICMAKKINREQIRRRQAEVKKAFIALMKFYPLTLDNLDGEIWRDIAGYEGHYQVSTFGRIKSFKNGKVRILKPFLQGDYIYIELHKDRKGKTMLVHRLVAEAFLPNPDAKPEVNHIDSVKLNNYVNNIEWCTHEENIQHAFATGLEKANRGEDSACAKLTNEQARYIRENPDNLTGIELAKKLDVPPTTISAIQLGLSYKNAGGPIRKSKVQRTPDHIREEICRLYKRGVAGCGYQALAKKFGLSLATITDIVRKGNG